MSANTKIEWTDRRWNPLRGYSRKSEGSRNCYAEGIAARFSGNGLAYGGLAKRVKRPDGSTEARWTGKVELVESVLLQPLRWKKPCKIFVNSMSDLFHESVPDEWIDRIFAVMALCPQHTFQILPKRPERMREYLKAARAHPLAIECMEIALERMLKNPKSNVGHGLILDGDIVHLKVWPLPNVWLGVSVEDQKTAEERIPLLLDTPAAIRFISAEPLLLDINVQRWLKVNWQCSNCRGYFADKYQKQCPDCKEKNSWCGSHKFNGRRLPKRAVVSHQSGIAIDWVICGGESGRNARPMHPDWPRALRDQCAAAGVPFFFKQWGEWAPCEHAHDKNDRAVVLSDGTLLQKERMLDFPDQSDAEIIARIGKARAGRLLDGITHNAFPEVAA